MEVLAAIGITACAAVGVFLIAGVIFLVSTILETHERVILIDNKIEEKDDE